MSVFLASVAKKMLFSLHRYLHLIDIIVAAMFLIYHRSREVYNSGFDNYVHIQYIQQEHSLTVA